MRQLPRDTLRNLNENPDAWELIATLEGLAGHDATTEDVRIALVLMGRGYAVADLKDFMVRLHDSRPLRNMADLEVALGRPETVERDDPGEHWRVDTAIGAAAEVKASASADKQARAAILIELSRELGRTGLPMKLYPVLYKASDPEFDWAVTKLRAGRRLDVVGDRLVDPQDRTPDLEDNHLDRDPDEIPAP